MDEEYMTPEERAELAGMLEKPLWEPQPGNNPQLAAYLSRADVVGYGGASGGGKSWLIIGKALTQHKYSLIIRNEAKDLQRLIDHVHSIVGKKGTFNANLNIWKELPGNRTIQFGGLKDPGSERHFQGRDADGIFFDEADQIPELRVRYVMNWNRPGGTGPSPKPQTVLCFNPPPDQTGEWLIRFFAPWIDESHPDPAKPGELRYFTMDGDREVEFKTGDEVEVSDPVYGTNKVRPMSRTFFPARVKDNKTLWDAGYANRIASLPSPYREQLLYGDFKIGRSGDAWQVIPTAFVKQAMARWRPGGERENLDCLGVDVSMGASDPSVIAPRHGNWFDHLILLRGTDTDSGRKLAHAVLNLHKPNAKVNVDMNGCGRAATEHLTGALGSLVRGVMVSERSEMTDRTGTLGMNTVKAELWWSLRDALDPDLEAQRGYTLALPPDDELLMELCAPRYKVTPQGVQIEGKEDVKKRLGRSTDRADAVCFAWHEASGVGTVMTSGDRHKEWGLGPPVHPEASEVTDDFGGGILLEDFGSGPEIDREDREWWEDL